MEKFEHLELPKTNIEYTRRLKPGFGGNQRKNRNSHGRKLLNQVNYLIDRPKKEHQPFGINPKLIFKLKLRKESYFLDEQVIKSGLNLVAIEPKSKQAIIVFPSDNDFNIFKQKLEAYSGLSEDYKMLL
jgi:hypothetical protein